MEEITLTSPEVQPEIRTTKYRVSSLLLDWDNMRITVALTGNNGERRAVDYGDAEVLLRALNTANLSTNSLHRRLMVRLLADGHLAGAIGGAPDA